MTIQTESKCTVKACGKCQVRFAGNAQYCSDCRGKFRRPKCKHLFSILDMDVNRVIKCSLKDCEEVRHG